MPMNKKPKAAWDDEPTPLCEKAAMDGRYFTDQGSCIELRPCDYKLVSNGEVVFIDVAQNLEKRLRHVLKLVNSLRIDVMHDDEVNDLDTSLLDERLSDIEEVLAP